MRWTLGWAGGRPRLISDEDIAFLLRTARTRPKKLGLPFTRWSLRKLAGYLAGNYCGQHAWPVRIVRAGRERLRQLLRAAGVSFQRTRTRTRTWKESPGPQKDTKLDRIEHVLEHFPDRCFAFDQF